MVGVGSHVEALVSLLKFGYLSTFVYETFGRLYAMWLKVVFVIFCVICKLKYKCDDIDHAMKL